MSASGRIVTAVQHSNVQVRHRRHRLLDVVQRVNNVLFHQHTNVLQISSQILNQSTKIHLSLMRQ